MEGAAAAAPAFPLRGFERLKNSPVDCMNASLDALRALQRERAGRPLERWMAEGQMDEVGVRIPADP